MKNKIVIFFISFLLFSLAYETTRAKTNEGNKINFSVMPVSDSDQVDGITSYIDLNAKPNEEKKIYVKLTNLKDEETVINIDPANGLTTKNGGIYYTVDNKTDYTSFLDENYAIKDRIKVERKVILGPNETKKIAVTVDVPNQNTGTYIGGLLFYQDQKRENNSKTNGDNNFTIQNRYTLGMAIELNMPIKEEPNIILGKTKTNVFASGIQMLIQMQNVSAAIATIKNVNYEIVDKNNQKVFGGEIKDIEMAPKTEINYPIFWGGKTITDGNYTIKFTADVNGKQAPYIATFSIEKKELKKYVEKLNQNNKQTIIVNNETPWWVWIIVGIFIILSFAAGFKTKRKK